MAVAVAIVVALLAGAPAADPAAACPVADGGIVQRLEACEARLQGAARADRQGLLLALGELHQQFRAWAYRCRPVGSGCPSFQDSPDEAALAAHAKAHEGEFLYEEPGETWEYTGVHYRLAVAVDPTTALAEEAGFRLYEVPDFIDCDWDPCGPFELHARMARIAEFLRAFPRSRRVPDVVAEANALFERSAADVVAFRACCSAEELPFADALPGHLAEYRRLIERLDPGPRTSACGAAAAAALALKDHSTARRLLACASRSRDEAIARRAKQRLAKLPR